MKTIFNLCEKYFHNSNIITYFAVCQYIFEIFFMQKRTLKYFKYFIYFIQKSAVFENNFHFFRVLCFWNENLKKSFIHTLFINKWKFVSFVWVFRRKMLMLRKCKTSASLRSANAKCKMQNAKLNCTPKKGHSANMR